MCMVCVKDDMSVYVIVNLIEFVELWFYPCRDNETSELAVFTYGKLYLDIVRLA